MQMDFSHKESQRRWRRLRIKIYLVGFLVCLLVLGGFYLVKEVEFFRLQGIEVVGLEQEKKEKFLADLALSVETNALTKLLSQDNYFFWPSEIKIVDLEYKKVAIDKDFFGHKATINIEKRERMGIWCYVTRPNNKQIQTNDERIFVENSFGLDGNSGEARECRWFDDEGILFKDAPESEGQLLFKIDEQSENSKELGEKVTSDDLFQNIKKILSGAEELNLSIKTIEFMNELQELRIKTREGAELKFGLRFDPEPATLPALKKLLSETPLSKIEYIDLTVENKLYLKSK